MSEFEKTARGFNVYGRIPTHAGGSVRVQDSSLAFEGQHVWLFLDGEQCTEHLGRHQKPDPQLSVEQAKQLRDALSAFITAAESNGLAEPVSETKCICFARPGHPHSMQCPLARAEDFTGEEPSSDPEPQK